MRYGQCLAALALALAVVGCGGGQKKVNAGHMPKGASFYGVWQSPQYGNLHLCRNGEQIFGDYFKNERSGRLQGKVVGDLARFSWEDQRELVQGRPTILTGRGYFKIAIGEDGDEYLQGEWGFDDRDHGGGPWNAVKLRKMKPERCLGGYEKPQDEVQTSWDDEDAEVIKEKDVP